VDSVLEFGTFPDASRVTVPALVPVPAAQVPLGKNRYVTVPVAVTVSELVTVAVSYALAPVVSEPDHAAFVEASNTVVAVLEVPLPTVNGSHGLVDPE
jgi:hypothetical protein